jgi:hypothetical protein
MLLLAIILSGCSSDADLASANLSKEAEMFRIERRIVIYNGITDTYILAIEGLCSVDFFPDKFTVTCKTGPKEFKKHYLGRADNVFPFVEQLASADVSTYRYKVIFKPTSIIPDVDLE